MTTRSGRSFGLDGDDGGGGSRKRKRGEEPKYAESDDSDDAYGYDSEDDPEYEAAGQGRGQGQRQGQGQGGTPGGTPGSTGSQAATPGGTAAPGGTPGNTGSQAESLPPAEPPKRTRRPPKKMMVNSRFEYMTPAAFGGDRQAYIDYHIALGAPRGCVDGQPEDYDAYKDRHERYHRWLKATLWVRNKARVPLYQKNPTYKAPTQTENPRRSDAAATDPQSWPKEPGGNETGFESRVRLAKYHMRVHEPGEYKGPWPEGVHPCEDINEPDPAGIARGAAPLRPCSNCLEHDPKLRCSPWRTWHFNERGAIIYNHDVRCERCKERGLEDCEIPVDHPRNGKVRMIAPAGVRPDVVPGNGDNGQLDQWGRPPPPPGMVYRYKGGRKGLMPAPKRKEIEEAMPAVTEFSCGRCVAKGLICSIVAAPTLGSLSGQTITADRPTCTECRREGVECETSEAWNNALQAQIARAAEQTQRINNEYEQEQLRAQEYVERRMAEAMETQRQLELENANKSQGLQAVGQNLMPSQDTIGFTSQTVTYQPPVPVEPLAEGFQCQQCVDDGRGDLCDINSPCTPCALKGLTFYDCRYIDPNSILDMDMAMDLDFGIGMDFEYPPGQQIPDVTEPLNLETPAPHFFGALDATNFQAPTMDPTGDPDLQVARAFGAAASIAQQRGIYQPPNAVPHNPAPLTDEERRQLILDHEYEGDYARMLWEEQQGRSGIPVVGQQAQMNAQPQQEMQQTLLDVMLQQTREQNEMLQQDERARRDLEFLASQQGRGHEDADVDMGGM